MLSITQNGYDLSIDGNVLPAQHSANIPIQFIKDEAYNDYVVIPHIQYSGVTNALTYNDGFVYIPKQAFKQDGYIRLAFLLSNGIEEINTNYIEIYVNASVGGVDVLPPDEKVWTTVVINAVDQYMDVKYIAILDDLIKNNNLLNTSTVELQKNVNDVVDLINQKLENNDFVPKHKWEQTVLHFSNPNGSWDEGFDISVIPNIIDTIYPIGTVVTNSKVTYDPNKLYLGTKWVRIKGKVIVGVDEVDSDFNIADKSGGAKSFNNYHGHAMSHSHTINGHTHSTSAVSLTVAQIPSHSHNISERFHDSNVYSFNASGASGVYGSSLLTKTTTSTGSGQAHGHGNTGSSGTLTSSDASTSSTGANGRSDQSILQPYITKYVWERIS